MSTQSIKCLIIGAGPAGYTAAIYAARASLQPVLYTGQEPGGQLTLTTEVENYPGYPNGINGPEMMEDFKKQAERFGTIIKYEKIERIAFTDSIHKLWISSKEVIETHTVIIATGASAKWLGIPSERRLMNKGVSACAVCDGFFFKGQEVAVIGGGDTAAEEASYLAKLCPKVHLLIRRGEMRASKIMQARISNMKNIMIHWHTEIDEILGKEEVEAIRIFDKKTNQKKIITLQGIFIAIGHQPNTDIFKGQLAMDEIGYLKTIAGSTKTNIEGVFASGDAVDKVYRQAVTAAGTGCMAALDAERYLTAKGIV